MTRVLFAAVVLGMGILGLFPGRLGPTSHAPVPYCGPTAGFQTAFARAGSEIVFLTDDASPEASEKIGQLEVELTR